MKKIRQDNDFALLWKIRRAGVIEDLSLATDMKLVRYVGRIGSVGREVPFEMPTLGQLRIEVTPTIADRLGVYIFALEYYLPDLSAADGNQKCKADVNAFEIVSRTAEADEVTTVECETDLMIGFRGKAFESEDFTPEEWTEIQRPSLEAAALANTATETSEVQTATVNRLSTEWAEAENTRNRQEGFRNQGEGARILADENRDIAEGDRTQGELLRDIAEGKRRSADEARDNAERIRLQAELDRDSAEVLRLRGETDREAAEAARVEADETRTTTVNQLKVDSTEAIRLTNIAKDGANTAADLAGDKAFLAQQETEKIAPVIEASEAATAFATEQGNFAKAEAEAIPAKIAEKSGPLEEKTIAQSLAELNAKVEALQALLASKMVDSIDVASELNILGKTNLILEGVGAPAIEPDFVGQRYIDTVGLVAYTAFHTASAGGWK